VKYVEQEQSKKHIVFLYTIEPYGATRIGYLWCRIVAFGLFNSGRTNVWSLL